MAMWLKSRRGRRCKNDPCARPLRHCGSHRIRQWLPWAACLGYCLGRTATVTPGSAVRHLRCEAGSCSQMLNPQSGNTVRMSARIRYLSLDEVVRFVNASDEEFRKLARGPLESGARYGELCDML